MLACSRYKSDGSGVLCRNLHTVVGVVNVAAHLNTLGRAGSRVVSRQGTFQVYKPGTPEGNLQDMGYGPKSQEFSSQQPKA